MIFTPKKQESLSIAEVSPEEIFEKIGNRFYTHNVSGVEYQVYLGSTRYQILKKQRSCVCCGVYGNRMFLDQDESLTSELGKPVYHFNLYAETYERTTQQTHMILLAKDHIVPKSKGGSDELDNFQVLCFNCNSIKSNTNLSLDQIRSLLFPAYRAYKSYKSSIALNKTRALLKPLYDQIIRNEKAIAAIKSAFDKIQNKEEVVLKIEFFQKQNDVLKQKIQTIELKAQTTGIILETEIKLSNIHESI